MTIRGYSINFVFQDVLDNWGYISFKIDDHKVSREEALNWAETIKASENIIYIEVFTTDASMFFTPVWEWRRDDCAVVRRKLTIKTRKHKGENYE